MVTEVKSTKVDTIITGKDLRIMRIHASITTSVMAEFLGIKSRKTIENWEQGQSQPTINHFLLFCRFAGFHPGPVIREVLKRNQEDPTQSKYFDLEACVLSQSS